ncbi:MAG: YceI family protein [Nitrospirota bacterium]|nr:YceI family protein [Nitrospirota bacterium]
MSNGRQMRGSRFSWVSAVALAMGLLAAPVANAKDVEFMIDPGHTTVGFTVKHMFSNTTGRFDDFSGTLSLDPKTGVLSAVKGVVKTASVNTNHEKRDGHLKSPDFFNVEKIPTMTFVGKTFRQDGKKQVVTGDFTLLGVTKSVTWEIEFLGVGADPWGGTRAGFTATTTIDRKDYGMTFNKVLDNGGLLVGEEVSLRLDIEAMLPPAPKK